VSIDDEQMLKHQALDLAIQCRPIDGECLESLYEAILTKLGEIDAMTPSKNA
jgi:hypothetical protein